MGGATFSTIGTGLPFLVAGFVLSLLSARSLNSVALGDELAAGLGERVALARATAAAGSVLLCGAATAVAGPIGFVGLVVPHLCRLLVGVDHGWLLPFSALTGACLLLLPAALVGAVLVLVADLIGQFAFGTRYPVGVITGVLGAPYLIYLIARTNRVGGSL